VGARVSAAVDLTTLVPARRGHFTLESGHHGNLWLDMERLCVQVAPVRSMALQLAEQLRNDRV
jgi:orotate phosphoribosyltransferase